MIRTGDTIRNPVTGERIIVHQTAADTGGEAVVIETFLDPGRCVGAMELHPSQEERLQVLRGTVGVRLGSTTCVAGPGLRITSTPGAAHCLWNAGDEVAQLVREIRPALQFESVLETMAVSR
jgi:quercetin dioxygenase-like cupin family protein